MRFKVAVAAIAAAAVGITAATAASADPNGNGGGDHHGDTFFAVTVQAANIDLGAAGFSLGDQFVFTDDLFDRRGGHKVGTDGGVCTIVRVTDAAAGTGTAQCVVTASITDHGQITTQGLVDESGDTTPPPFDSAITGGTGDFADAGGFITVEELSETEANITVHLLHLR
jgi:hypothetical protein